VINGHKLNGSSRAVLHALKEAIRQAVLTMLAMPDLDVRYRGHLRSAWSISAPDDPTVSYGYSEIKIPRLNPTPKDVSRAEVIDGWLVWLRGTEGRRALYRVTAWARGLPIWLLAQQEKCSERTITNRIDRSMAAILAEFLCAEADVEVINEPADEPVRAFHGKHVSEFEGSVEKHGKCWISGVGFMRDGRRLMDGRNKTDDRRLYRDRAR
jgi:hypothetical protein